MMQLLFDTHTLFSWTNDPKSLLTKARTAISNAANDCFFSLASCWKFAIKWCPGKLALVTADAAIARYDVKCLW